MKLLVLMRKIANIVSKYIKKVLKPYAMKVACTVFRGGNFSNKTTYLNRPYAALLLLVTEYDIMSLSV